jgi:myosin heavy subunit
MSTNEPKSEIVPEIRALTMGRIFRDPPLELSVKEQVLVHALLKFLEDQVKSRQKVIKDPLISIAESQGSSTESGKSKQLEVDGSKVTCEYRTSSLPEEKAFRVLLAQKNIPLEEAFTEVKTLQMDPSKIEYLVQTGKVTEQEVSALKSQTKALRIYPSKALEETIDRLEKLASGQILVEESFELPPTASKRGKRK